MSRGNSQVLIPGRPAEPKRALAHRHKASHLCATSQRPGGDSAGNPRVKLKLDENLNERGRALLAGAGHEVSTAISQGLHGTVDEALIEICRRQGRGLVTLDLDFANMRGVMSYAAQLN